MAKYSNVRKSGKKGGYALSNFLIGFFMAIVLLLIDIWAIVFFGLEINEAMIIVLISLVMYAVLLAILARTSQRKIMAKGRERNGVINAIVEEIRDSGKVAEAKKGARAGMKTEGDMIVSMPKEKFIGSSETKTYHARECRVAGQIKPRHRLASNSEAFFRSKKFRPHTCIKKKK